jgi:biotin transport system substrate-specific component
MQPAGASRALALAVWPDRVSRMLQALVLMIGGTLVLAISARISVPFYPVPMTLQTFAVMAIAAAYGSRLAVATVVLYLLEGCIGLPVFANTALGAVGPAYFLGTTGGFLIGFIALAWIVGAAADRGWDHSIPKLFAAMIVADAVVFACGFAWLAWGATLSPGLLKLLNLPAGTAGAGAAFAWAQGVVPFLLADLLKIALAALAVPATWLLIERKP